MVAWPINTATSVKPGVPLQFVMILHASTKILVESHVSKKFDWFYNLELLR